MSDGPQGDHARYFEALAAQGVDIDTMGLAYGRKAFPDLPTMDPEQAFIHGFAAGVHAVLMQWQLVQARDWGEFYARLYDTDVLPVGKE